MKDFFISFATADSAWARWIDQELRAVGHSTFYQLADFRAGGSFVERMDEGATRTHRTLGVLSPHALASEYVRAEWDAALTADPRGKLRRLLLVKVAACAPAGLLASRIYVDLLGKSEEEARAALRTALAEEVPADTEPVLFPGAAANADAVPFPGLRIDTTRLPTPGEHFVGRQAELARLDAAWANPQVNVLSIVAFGGVGKSALVFRWLDRLRRDNWRGATRVLAWSFYSQGTQERLASADAFIDYALRWCGDPDSTLGSPRDRGLRLAELMRRQRTLLILDGLEPLQHPPMALGGGRTQPGRLKDPGMAALLKTLAQANDGLCVVTTRERVAELAPHEHEGGAAGLITPESLSPEDGAELLRQLEVKGKPEELQAATQEYAGHALTLTLLGSYLRDACGGDVRRRSEIPLGEADQLEGDGHAFQVMAAYEQWLGNNPLSPGHRGEGRGDGEASSATAPTRPGHAGTTTSDPPELAILRLLGLFDRPAAGALVTALRTTPALVGLTEPLHALSNDEWQWALTTLRRRGLLGARDAHDPDALDAHPLVRAYFAERMKQDRPDAWRAGHLRLYEHLCRAAPDQPDTLEEMVPLYQAVVHGCRAGCAQAVFDDVFWPRIRREEEGHSIHTLGAFSEELVAIAAFFKRLWDQPENDLNHSSQAIVLKEAGSILRALGRPADAFHPMKAALGAARDERDWKRAAITASHLSGLSVALGHIRRAIDFGQQCVGWADKSHDPEQRILSRTTLGVALFVGGSCDKSLELFQDVESRIARLSARQRKTLLLAISICRYRYCFMLLQCAEPDDGSGLDGITGAADGPIRQRYRETCHEVLGRASKALDALQARKWHLDVALNYLVLGLAELGQALTGVDDSDAAFAQASMHLGSAVEGLRKAGREDHVPRGLLARAAFHRLRAVRGADASDAQASRTAAEADLTEALDIGTRGEMRQHIADAHLEWTRLHLDHGEIEDARKHHEQAREHHEQARQLVAETGYHRRDREVAYLARRLSEKQ